MPRYYFEITDRLGVTPDPVGIELDDSAQAYAYAIESIRSIVADDARRGMMDLAGHIDVSDDVGLVVRVLYAWAFAPGTAARRGQGDADNDNAATAGGSRERTRAGLIPPLHAEVVAECRRTAHIIPNAAALFAAKAGTGRLPWAFSMQRPEI